MPYFPVDDQFAFHPKTIAAGNSAIGLWTRAGSWSKAHATGGFVPAAQARALGTGVECRKLVTSGLWITVEGGYQFHDWTKQAGNFDAPTEKSNREAVREANRLRKAAQRERDKSRGHGGSHAVTSEGVTPQVTPDVTDTPYPYPITSTSDEVEAARSDVTELCVLLAGLIQRNGSNPPTISKRWLTDARLLLDADGRELGKALNLIRWCQDDPFWRANVLSMGKFRKQYDALRLAALADWEKRAHRTSSNASQALDLAAQLAQEEAMENRMEIEA